MVGLFDGIELPEEDKDKTAEIKKEEEEHEELDADKSDTSKQAADDKSGDDDTGKKSEADTSKDDDKAGDGDKESVDASDDKKDDDKTSDKDKNTAPPFHEHPDWIKHEQALKEKELEVAKLQGQIEVLEKKSTPEAERETKKVERQRAAVVAEQKVIKKMEEGWKPKDVLEQQRVFSEFFEEELDLREKEKDEARSKEEKQLEETRNKIAGEVANIYKENGITSDSDKDAASELALQWAKDGTANWSTKTLALAVKQLKLEGKIGKTEVKITPKKEDNVEDKKDDKDSVNKKIARNSQKDSGDKKANKKSYAQMHKKSLDDIILEQQDALG